MFQTEPEKRSDEDLDACSVSKDLDQLFITISNLFFTHNIKNTLMLDVSYVVIVLIKVFWSFLFLLTFIKPSSNVCFGIQLYQSIVFNASKFPDQQHKATSAGCPGSIHCIVATNLHNAAIHFARPMHSRPILWHWGLARPKASVHFWMPDRMDRCPSRASKERIRWISQ